MPGLRRQLARKAQQPRVERWQQYRLPPGPYAIKAEREVRLLAEDFEASGEVQQLVVLDEVANRPHAHDPALPVPLATEDAACND